MQTFASDFPLNSVQNLLVIASEIEEKFDFSPSNVVAGVKICDTLDILEEISTRVIYSLPMIYIFQQIPVGLHAPKFKILKKKKDVHPPSRLTIYLNMILNLLDLI